MALSSGPASKRRRLTNALVGFGLGSVLVLYFLSSVITYTILGQADMRSEVLLWALDGGDGGGDGVQPCADVSSAAACERVVAQGLCERDDSALRLCRQSCGLCVGGRVERRGDELAAAVRTTAEPANEASPPSFSRPCVDRNAACTAWANEGECDANPNYMRAECARSCYVCESDLCSDDNGGHCSALPLSECADKATAQRCPFRCGACGLVFSPRCARKPGIGPAKPAGALGRMFKALSAPGARPAARVLSADPYVLLFEDFLSDEEVDALVVKGGHHFERSLAGDGITPVRTSSTSWCNVPACEDDPTVQAVRERISRLVGIPWENAEHLQVLRYQPSEFYKSHHDQASCHAPPRTLRCACPAWASSACIPPRPVPPRRMRYPSPPGA